MKYLSTRDDSLSRSFNDILYQGLSRDGGLYLPRSWPKINLLSLKNRSYEEEDDYRKSFQTFVDAIWLEKQQTFKDLKF